LTYEGQWLRNMPATKAISGFEHLGYQVVTREGSHCVLKHPERGLLVLPFHRDTVKAAIILDALRKAS